MKRILLLAHASGGEPDFAAQNLAEAVTRLAPADVRLDTVDLLAARSGRFEGLLGRAFSSRLSIEQEDGRGINPGLEMKATSLGAPAPLRDSLWDVLRSQEPDVVVFTSRVYGALLAEIYRAGRERDFVSIAVATGLSVQAGAWAHLPADYFIVAGESIAHDFAVAGVAREKIKDFGFSLQLPAPENGRKISLPRESGKATRRILYLINSARRKAPKMIDRLMEQPDWRVTVCLDGESDLEEMARARVAEAPERLELIAHMRELPRLLREHHVVITQSGTGIVHEAIAARCPLIVPKLGSAREQANLDALRRANAATLAEKPREVAAWLKRAFMGEGQLLALWRKNIEALGHGDANLDLARFVLKEAAAIGEAPATELRALPAPSLMDGGAKDKHGSGRAGAMRWPRLSKGLLLCDLHAHTTWSDGKLGVREIVDFYGQRGFDCLCITDHLCDPNRLLGKLVNLTGLVIPPGDVADYFAAIEREKKRAWSKYDLLLMTGIEFNKDGYTPKTSAHLLGVDLKRPIDPSLSIEETIGEIHAQGALGIASHPHETKSSWGKDTLYFWEHVDDYAPLLDAWEVANRDDIFNPVGLKKLPFIASSDFHKPKHIHSWKTLLYCEKEAEAIKQCIRLNRDVSMTLYRDHRFGWEEKEQPALESEKLPKVGT